MMVAGHKMAQERYEGSKLFMGDMFLFSRVTLRPLGCTHLKFDMTQRK
jgi:hypothetical protein